MKYLKHSILPLILLPAVLFSFKSRRSSPEAIQPDLKTMILVQGGTFMMGLDSVSLQRDMKRFNERADFFSQEYPAFRVTVQSFYMDKYDVTNSDYKKFIDANPQWSKAHIPDSLQDGNYLKD